MRVNAIEEMKEFKQWVNWADEERSGPDGSTRKTKVLKNPRTGNNASSTDPSTWATYEDAKARSDKIGFVFTEAAGIVGIDIDKCVDDSGVPSDMAKRIIDELNSYTEYSPSGTGLHIYMKGTIPRGFNNRNNGVEMYFEGRFFTVTEIRYFGASATLADNQEMLTKVFEEYKTSDPDASVDVSNVKPSEGRVNRFGTTLEEIRKKDDKMNCLLNNDNSAHPSASEADLATMQKLYFWAFEDGEILSIVEEYRMREKFKKNRNYLTRTLSKVRRGGDQVSGPLGAKVTGAGHNNDEEDKDKKSQADRILEYLANENKFKIKLFCDQRQVPYIELSNLDTQIAQIHRIKSKYVKFFLIGLLWDNEEKAASETAIRSAVSVLMARALDSTSIPLFNRVAKDGDAIWLDMCDDSWNAIKITKDGWKVCKPPILFRRHNHQKPLSTPKRGGSITPLLLFLKFNNLGDQLLFLVQSISWLIPDISHIISQTYGMQGGGKSLLQKAVKQSIDPSAIPAFASIPRNQRELIRILDQHYITIFDNISYMPRWSSDVFCSAVTGAGQSYRELYTDSEEVIYEYRRCIAFNGISLPGTEPDILDRSGLFEQCLKETDRKTESELDEHLSKSAPEILGGFLDILVASINNYPKMQEKVKTLERMADFTIWGCAITKAMGLKHEWFLEAYKANINNQKVEAINASPIADCLLSVLDKRGGAFTDNSWSGTMSQLFTTIKAEAKEIKIDTRQKQFPKNPTALGKRLRKLEPLLPIIGYKLERSRTGKTRKISFMRVPREESFDKPLDWGLGTDIASYLGEDVKEAVDALPTSVEVVVEVEVEHHLEDREREFIEVLRELHRTAEHERVGYNELVKELVKGEWTPTEVKKITKLLQTAKVIIFDPLDGCVSLTGGI